MRICIPVPSSLALACMFLLGSVGSSIYLVNGMAPSGAFLLLYFVGVAWAFAWWVLEDCLRLGVDTSIDHGWFVFYAWPLVVPYHLIKTRRAAGCAFIAGFVIVFLLAYAAGVVVYLIGAAVR